MKKVVLGSLAMVLALCMGAGTAMARSSYYSNWMTAYPGSQSGQNVVTATGSSCALCHSNSGGGDPWNAYGWALRQQIVSGVAIASALTAVASLNSDNDPTSATNLAEITASTQPGWTAGATNTFFFADGTTQSGRSAPAGLLSLDPTAAPVPSIGVAPTALAFGAVTTGLGGTMTTTISNTGQAGLVVSALTLSGSADFAVNPAPALPLTVPAGGSTTVSIAYTPSGVGADSGALAIASNDAQTPSISVSLTGTGVGPTPACTVSVSPLALAFGSVAPGTTVAQTTTITNIGTANCSVGVLALSGSADFTLGSVAPPLPSAVAPGGTVSVSVNYTPSAAGGASGTLAISSDDPANPSVSVSLTGNGVGVVPGPAIGVTPLTLDFGPVTTGLNGGGTTTISNTGGSDLIVTGVTLGGSADFWLNSTLALPLTIPVGGSVDLSIVYIPTDLGADTGTLTVASSDPSSPTVAVALSGTGVLPAGPPPATVCGASVSPLALTFGSVQVGGTATLTTTITNIGMGNCTLSNLALAGSTDFVLGAGPWTPPQTIVPGGTLDVQLSYAPSAAGNASGTLAVVTDDPRNPSVSVSLTGTGAVPQRGDDDEDDDHDGDHDGDHHGTRHDRRHGDHHDGSHEGRGSHDRD